MLSWEWKLFLLNATCQSVFVLYTSLTLFLGLHTTLPDVYKHDANTLFNRKLLAVVLFFNVIGNYLCIKIKSRHSIFCRQLKSPEKENNFNNNLRFNSSRNPAVNNITLENSYSANQCMGNGLNNHNALNTNPALNIAGFSECRHCNNLSPPRSKHCPLCRSCILKRDHHCFFAGCCIGFHNQRHFIMFCFYGSIGAFYSGVATYAYVKENYETFAEWGIITYFLPVLLVLWLVGFASGSSVLFVLFFYWNLFTSTLCLYFFVLQILLVFRGQSKYEFKKNIFPYRSDFQHNVMSVFGSSRFGCFIGLVVPAPFVGYFGDGKSWDELSGGIKLS